MKYLLDTNTVIATLKGKPSILARLRAYLPSDFGLPSIVAHELFYGAYKSQRAAANLARIEALQFEVIGFDAEDAQHAGEIRAQLAAAGTPIGPSDVLIAGQARAPIGAHYAQCARILASSGLDGRRLAPCPP